DMAWAKPALAVSNTFGSTKSTIPTDVRAYQGLRIVRSTRGDRRKDNGPPHMVHASRPGSVGEGPLPESPAIKDGREWVK
ncbi:MAG: hypothetical protein ACREBC_27385, partial [Pyrinomonadaceae bacterium]